MGSAFVVLGNPRTGSNHLISMLNSSAEIDCHSELFHPHAVWARGGVLEGKLEQRNVDPIGFLEEFRSQSEAMFGFKIFMHHNDDVIQHVIQSSAYKKLVLYRRNVLAVYSSNKIAAETKEYFRSSSDKTERPKVRVDFDVDEFNSFRDAYENHYRSILRRLNHNNQNYDFICYEHLQSHPVVRRTFAFLGVTQPQNLESSTAKINATNILDRFNNQTFVSEFLKVEGLQEWAFESFVHL